MTDFDELQKIACGYCGLSFSDFWEATPREINNVIAGAQMRREQHERFELEKARLTAFWVIMPNVKKGKSFKPSDLGKFSWEEVQKDSPEFKDLVEAYKSEPQTLPK